MYRSAPAKHHLDIVCILKRDRRWQVLCQLFPVQRDRPDSTTDAIRICHDDLDSFAAESADSCEAAPVAGAVISAWNPAASFLEDQDSTLMGMRLGGGGASAPLATSSMSGWSYAHMIRIGK